jgi:hypothetical protein
VTTQGSKSTELQEQNRKKDYIERNFGTLEESFMKSIGETPRPPKRSRDDSIKLIYDIKDPSDWLDMVDAHDDHVSLLQFHLYFDLI